MTKPLLCDEVVGIDEEGGDGEEREAALVESRQFKSVLHQMQVMFDEALASKDNVKQDLNILTECGAVKEAEMGESLSYFQHKMTKLAKTVSEKVEESKIIRKG